MRENRKQIEKQTGEGGTPPSYDLALASRIEALERQWTTMLGGLKAQRALFDQFFNEVDRRMHLDRRKVYRA